MSSKSAKKRNKTKKKKSRGFDVYRGKDGKIEVRVWSIKCPQCGGLFSLRLNELPTQRLIKRVVTCAFCPDTVTVYYDFKDNSRFVFDSDRTVKVGRFTIQERNLLTNLLARQYKAELHAFRNNANPKQGQAHYVHTLKNVCDKMFLAIEGMDETAEKMGKLDRLIKSSKNLNYDIEAAA